MNKQLSIDAETIDRVFWDAAAPGTPTDGIKDFLAFLSKSQIRTAVISNISYCGKAVVDRINACIPENEFEFVIATSEYMYRKPNKKIFELALEKAGVSAGNVWYVGDHYECDIAGAKNAGIIPVWYIGAVNINDPINKEVLTVKSWQELEQIINEKALY